MRLGGGQGWPRRGTSIALSAIGALLLLVGGILFYAGREIFDSRRFADRTVEALHHAEVRDPLSAAIVDGLIQNAEADLINARPVLVSVISSLLDSGAFTSVFRSAAERAHQTVFTREGNDLVLNLADGAQLAVDGLAAVSPDLAKQIPDDATARLNELVSSEAVIGLAKAAEEVRFFGYVLPLAGILLLAAAVWIERDRRRGFMHASVAVAVGAGIGLAVLLGGKAIVVGQVGNEFQDAASAAWDAFLGDLRTGFALALGGALIATAAIATRVHVDAADPLRRAAKLAARVPEARWAKVTRVLVVLLVGLLAVFSPEAFLRVLTIAIGAYAIFFALTELLAMISPPAEAPRERRRLRRRWPVLVAAATVLAGVVVVAVVLIDDGVRQTQARDPASIERCNGFAELCDRRVNEVAFPGVHNAMSAARDDFLIANNDKPIPDQLEAGIRALLIDVHYGREGRGGVVSTDLEREGQTRSEIVDQVGEEFVDTAERLVGRITGVEGESEPYFCHVFCELGAIPLVDELVRVRKFLETHPDEVVVLFIEDYVKPREIEQGFIDADLVDYAWEQQLGEPLPTLREMIASGKRLLVMAENEGGGSEIPWYLQGFDFAQETPFTFNSPEELKAKKACDPNRGGVDKPLFQLNHWIERIPRSPRTAAVVNDFDFLYERASRCQRKRGVMPNLIGVDFWEQGDVLEVAQRLNHLGPAAEPEYATTD